jgi:hypothetical protein
MRVVSNDQREARLECRHSTAARCLFRNLVDFVAIKPSKQCIGPPRSFAAIPILCVELDLAESRMNSQAARANIGKDVESCRLATPGLGSSRCRLV